MTDDGQLGPVVPAQDGGIVPESVPEPGAGAVGAARRLLGGRR